MGHRLRDAYDEGKSNMIFMGEIEADEIYFGGKERNKHADKRLKQRGNVR